jgi:hypothetical protein
MLSMTAALQLNHHDVANRAGEKDRLAAEQDFKVISERAYAKIDP